MIAKIAKDEKGVLVSKECDQWPCHCTACEDDCPLDNDNGGKNAVDDNKISEEES